MNLRDSQSEKAYQEWGQFVDSIQNLLDQVQAEYDLASKQDTDLRDLSHPDRGLKARFRELQSEQDLV